MREVTGALDLQVTKPFLHIDKEPSGCPWERTALTFPRDPLIIPFSKACLARGLLGPLYHLLHP